MNPNPDIPLEPGDTKIDIFPLDYAVKLLKQIGIECGLPLAFIPGVDAKFRSVVEKAYKEKSVFLIQAHDDANKQLLHNMLVVKQARITFNLAKSTPPKAPDSPKPIAPKPGSASPSANQAPESVPPQKKEN